jgi:hypothetical protein
MQPEYRANTGFAAKIHSEAKIGIVKQKSGRSHPALHQKSLLHQKKGNNVVGSPNILSHRRLCQGGHP